MAMTDWDRATTLQQMARGDGLKAIVRGYDEPDANLHYEAQRLMYRAIADITDAPNSNVQIVVCTHSLTLIDRVPAKSINLLGLENGCTTVRRLEIEEDPAIEHFLTELAQEMGITNSIMFYEKCLVLIEGETEANDLPLLYRTLYRRSLLEDGIRVINVKGNGATREFLRLLGRNRQQLTIAFMDRDTDTEDYGERAKLTRDEFRAAGFSDEFISERLLYIGDKEFEDAFSDDVLARALQEAYPKADDIWQPEEIAALRGCKKMSDALKKLVHCHGTPTGNKWGKPVLGKFLGRACCSADQIPHEIIALFRLARQIAGCE
jgi:predicted ATP-dependent endonuclease of OLD family